MDKGIPKLRGIVIGMVAKIEVHGKIFRIFRGNMDVQIHQTFKNRIAVGEGSSRRRIWVSSGTASSASFNSSEISSSGYSGHRILRPAQSWR